jgi:ferredoxin
MKNPPYRSRKWLAAVRGLEECVICGAHGVIQAAHRNEGKGMGIKTSDCLTAALCQYCHTMIDQGKEMSRMERRAEMDRAIVLTIEQLVKSGRLIISEKKS